MDNLTSSGFVFPHGFGRDGMLCILRVVIQEASQVVSTTGAGSVAGRIQ
jgi:hypothetical protein